MPPTRARARARTRAYPVRWGRGAANHLAATLGDYRPLWEATPAPVDRVWAWACAGDWPGNGAGPLRAAYCAYTTLVAVPVTALAYWAAGALMQVTGLDSPDDARQGRVPVPPPLAELWWRLRADLEGLDRWRWPAALAGCAAVAAVGVLLAGAWTAQRIGRSAVAALTVLLCVWG